MNQMNEMNEMIKIKMEIVTMNSRYAFILALTLLLLIMIFAGCATDRFDEAIVIKPGPHFFIDDYLIA